jgi:hypothetical protein
MTVSFFALLPFVLAGIYIFISNKYQDFTVWRNSAGWMPVFQDGAQPTLTTSNCNGEATCIIVGGNGVHQAFGFLAQNRANLATNNFVYFNFWLNFAATTISDLAVTLNEVAGNTFTVQGNSVSLDGNLCSGRD